VTAAPGSAALLIVDVVNDFAFEDAGDLLGFMDDVAGVIDGLRGQAAALGLPVIYINDNYGHWHSDVSGIVDRCLGQEGPGSEIVARLLPRPDDYFVIKPQFSGFYATTLPVLLPKLGVNRVVLTGIAADICILFTAADAHMRDYDLWVPRDGVASSSAAHRDWALGIMDKSMDADTRPTTELALADWVARA